MAEQYTLPRIQCINLEEDTFCYRSAGNGTAVILLHAGIADSRMWWPQYGSLSERFMIVAPDLPGYGSSAVLKKANSYSDLLHQLLNELQISRGWFVGVSFGSRILLDYYQAYRNEVEGMIIVSPLLDKYAETEEISTFAEQEEKYLSTNDIRSATELNMQMWLAGPRRALEGIDEGVRERVHEMQLNAFEKQVGTESRRIVPEYDMEKLLSSINIPLLLMYGNLDHACVVKSAQDIQRTVSSSSMWVAEGAAHLLNVEKPDRFNEQILKYIKQ